MTYILSAPSKSGYRGEFGTLDAVREQAARLLSGYETVSVDDLVEVEEAMSTPALAYLRVSGRDQVDGDGFTRQLLEIQQYAKANGYQIVKVFQEKGVSGENEWEDRPAWVEMVTSLNGVQTVMVECLNRLARELFVQEYILRDLRKRGVRLISVREQDIDSSPERVLFRQIMGAIAQYDKAMIVMKLRGARSRIRRETGRCEGRKPFGFHDKERSTLETMRLLRAAGMGWTEIASTLNDAGHATRRGGNWRASTVHKVLTRG